MLHNVPDWAFGANIGLHGERTMAKANTAASFLCTAFTSAGDFVEERPRLAVEGQKPDWGALLELGAAAIVAK
jgi:hypothetical protein